MKFAFVADVHIANFGWCAGDMIAGVNDRARTVLDVLERAAETAYQAGAREFVILGDLFDVAAPTPQLVAAVAHSLKFIVRERGYGTPPMRVTVLKGNHDSVSDTRGDNALGPLRYVHERVSVVDVAQPLTVDATGFCEVLPFQAGPSAEWLPGAWKASLTERARIVGLHLGIADERTPAFLRGAADSVDVDTLLQLARGSASPVEFVVAGNWHTHRAWELFDTITNKPLHVIQCGTLCPADFSDAEPMDQSNYGRLVLVDTTDRSWESVEISGPRFEVVAWDDTAIDWVKKLVKYAKKRGHKLYVQVKAEPRHLREAREAMTGVKGLAGYRVLPDTSAIKKVAAEAAAATRSTTRLTDAVRGYVAKMPLTDDVDREELTTELLGFLGGKA